MNSVWGLFDTRLVRNVSREHITDPNNDYCGYASPTSLRIVMWSVPETEYDHDQQRLELLISSFHPLCLKLWIPGAVPASLRYPRKDWVLLIFLCGHWSCLLTCTSSHHWTVSWTLARTGRTTARIQLITPLTPGSYPAAFEIVGWTVRAKFNVKY